MKNTVKEFKIKSSKLSYLTINNKDKKIIKKATKNKQNTSKKEKNQNS